MQVLFFQKYSVNLGSDTELLLSHYPAHRHTCKCLHLAAFSSLGIISLLSLHNYLAVHFLDLWDTKFKSACIFFPAVWPVGQNCSS